MLVSSVADLVKWDASLDTESLLKRTSFERMWTPARLSKGPDAEYGFGWAIRKVNGHRLIAHGGGIPGFSTHLSRFLDDHLTIIVLTNADSGNASGLAQGIAARLVPALAEKAEQPIADTDPHRSLQLKEVIHEAMKGEVDAELFTKAARAALVPRMKQDKGAFTSFGALKSFQLLERKESELGVQLRYRAEFENETLNAVFDLDKAGKIARLGLRPTD